MKLELKHLAPYLPYKLKGKLENEDYYPTTIGELYRLETSADSDNIPYCIVDGYEGEIIDFKPILRPLSDLEEFSPAIYNYLVKNCKNYVVRLQQIDYNVLIENHFDVFGLIEKGLAIDINSLP